MKEKMKEREGDGDSDTKPTCTCRLGTERAQQRNRGVCQHFRLRKAAPSLSLRADTSVLPQCLLPFEMFAAPVLKLRVSEFNSETRWALLG